MSHLDKLYISATGMITPVGFDTQMTIASVKAGISAYQESSYYNRHYQKMKLAPIPDEAFSLPELETDKPLAKQIRYQRMLGIASVAISEALANYEDAQPIPLFLGGPEAITAQEATINSDFIKHLAEISEANLDLSRSRIFATGRTSLLEAIDLAFTYIDQTGASHVLVGGVDSYIDPNVLANLELQDRILTASNSDGFAPAEGASFLLLSKNSTVLKPMPNKAVFINRPGFADEQGHRYSTAPYRGDGLAAATRSALHSVNSLQVQSLFSSMNGESFAAKELGVTMLRNSNKLSTELQIEHPADAFGDMGAAVTAVLITLASVTNPLSLVCASAEKAKRAACVVGVA